MEGFITNQQVLDEKAGAMVDTNEQLQDNGRKLAQAVDSVQGAWKGAAATAFTTLMTQYHSDFKNLNDALFKIAEEVSSSATDYAAQEQAAADDVSAILHTLENG
jgi:WXG100 family type VII secretion target